MEAYFPVFFIILVALAIERRNRLQLQIMRIRKRRKERKIMDNSILLRYKDKECIITANGYLSGIVGKVIEVSENWITVEDKKGKLTSFNCDYISSIKEK
ncbi:MAG: hypothetical protein IJA39_02325 [Clostridia bacterium]|nr:hypothetical protein [Clostridia bacterium]